MGLFLRFWHSSSVRSDTLDAAQQCLPSGWVLRCPKNKTLGFAEIVWVRLCNLGFKLNPSPGAQDDPRLRLRVALGSFM